MAFWYCRLFAALCIFPSKGINLLTPRIVARIQGPATEQLLEVAAGEERWRGGGRLRCGEGIGAVWLGGAGEHVLGVEEDVVDGQVAVPVLTHLHLNDDLRE
jgi:hypothetical protein